ncbi:hypothetical protein MKW92_035396 [Papaver armeniacum]|nr:hypothetical protein MKW92_035396 [Papaver armeniacum]
MDGENSKKLNDETPYVCNDDISEADPGAASLNEVKDHVPVDDNIFKMDAVRSELPPPNPDKSKHVDQGKSTKKRVRKSRKAKEYPDKIRTSNGYIVYDVKTDLRNMLKERFRAGKRKQMEALKKQNESSEPAALVVTAAVSSSPSASA